MMSVLLQQPIPDFSASATHGEFTLSTTLKKNKKIVVLYFYPKDNTPGCSTESAEFRDHYQAFQQANVEIFGLSRDSLTSHRNFKTKFALPFELISDPDEQVCQLFAVIKMKNLYGKQVRGIERSTFVIDANGVLVHAWRGVKVPGHVAEVLAVVQGLAAS